MSANKIIVLALFIIPFLFVFGIIASSVEDLPPISNGNNYIWMSQVSACGRRLEYVSENIVYMEIDIIQKIMAGLFKARCFERSARLNKLRLLAEDMFERRG